MNLRITNRIKEYRLKLGISQEELGEHVGVSRQSINSIERGRYIPSLPLALRFSQYFGCETDELFQLEEMHSHGSTAHHHRQLVQTG